MHPVSTHPARDHGSVDGSAKQVGNVDRLAAAAQRIEGVHQEFARRARTETIDHGIDAVAGGERARSFGDRAAFVLRQHFDPLRRKLLHPIESAAVAGGTEDTSSAAVKCAEGRAEAESTGEAVDEYRLARPAFALRSAA